MTREQTSALALLIQRGAGNALDIPREGNSPEGLAEAALAYARACDWRSPTETLGLRQAAHAHVTCRIELTETRRRVDALELALAAVLGAARVEPPHLENLVAAIEHAGEVLASEP